GGRELLACDRGSLLEELPGFGAPGLLALLAAVREQIVVPGNAVHSGGGPVCMQPALVETVGPGTCVGPENFQSEPHDQPKPNRSGKSGAGVRQGFVPM